MNYFLFTLYAIFICIYLLRQYNCFTKIFQVVCITYWYGCTVIFQSNLNTVTFFSLFFKLIFFILTDAGLTWDEPGGNNNSPQTVDAGISALLPTRQVCSSYRLRLWNNRIFLVYQPVGYPIKRACVQSKIWIVISKNVGM